MALLDTESLTLDVYPVPHEHVVTGKTKTGKPRKRLKTTCCALAAILADLTSHADVAFLELQWGWEGQAAGSSFTFGETFGVIKASTAAGFLRAGLSIEQADEALHFIKAEDWKNAMKLGGDKEKAVRLASAIFPFAEQAFELVSAAEASLIALYGATKLGVKLTPGSAFSPRLRACTDVVSSLVIAQ